MHILNQFFDKVFVLTIESATNRQSIIKEEFKDLDFEFIYGINKNEIHIDQWIKDGKYSETNAMQHERFSRKMNRGEIACAYGHRMIYQKILDQNLNKVLILEDDILFDEEKAKLIQVIMSELPTKWNILYLDYDKNEKNHIGTFFKQCFYSFQHIFGLMKFNFRMIWNYYSKPFSKHLRKAGYHYFTSAYVIDSIAAKKLIEIQTPIQFPSDHLIAWAISNELLSGFIATPRIITQTSRTGDGSSSMVYEKR